MGLTEKQWLAEARKLRYRHQMGFAQYSGGLETEHLSDLYYIMDCLLKKHATAPYCENVAKYVIGIYTDGNIVRYGYDGVSKVRLLAKDRSISCCMGVTEALWRGRTADEMRAPLADLWRECFEGFAKRIEKAKFEFNRDLYFSDISRVIDEFMVAEVAPRSSSEEGTLREALQYLVEIHRHRSELGEVLPPISEEILQYVATPEV